MKQTDTTTGSKSSHAKLLQNLRGILLPFVTPFDGDGGVLTSGIRSNIERWNEAGVSGYVALGSTGERVHLDEGEYLRVVETARECVPSQAAFIVGAGLQSTQASIAEVRRVAGAGADAVLVITPHFYRAEMTQSALANHYVAVADASPLPVLLYSVPSFTNVALQPQTIARLSEHENIVGVKDSSGDILSLAETVRLVPQDFIVLTGNGSALYPALCVGARGAILAVGCIAPRLAVAIAEAFAAGEHGRAREMQQRLTMITRGIHVSYGISGLKAALDMLGYAGGRVRAPLIDASEEARREIREVLKVTGLLIDEAGGDEERRLQAGASTK